MTGDTAQILQLHLKYVCKWAGREVGHVYLLKTILKCQARLLIYGLLVW